MPDPTQDRGGGQLDPGRLDVALQPGLEDLREGERVTEEPVDLALLLRGERGALVAARGEPLARAALGVAAHALTRPRSRTEPSRPRSMIRNQAKGRSASTFTCTP